MKRSTFVLGSFAVFAALALPCAAQTPKPAVPTQKQAMPLPPQKYEMALMFIADGQPHEYIFIINNAVGFRTIASLKEFVANLTPGSTLTWAPSDCRLGPEPPLSSPAAMTDFEAFCRSKKIKFVPVSLSCNFSACFVSQKPYSDDWRPL